MAPQASNILVCFLGGMGMEVTSDCFVANEYTHPCACHMHLFMLISDFSAQVKRANPALPPPTCEDHEGFLTQRRACDRG